MNNLTPAQALNILAQIADRAALNGPDRRLVDASIKLLEAAIAPADTSGKVINFPLGDSAPADAGAAPAS